MMASHPPGTTPRSSRAALRAQAGRGAITEHCRRACLKPLEQRAMEARARGAIVQVRMSGPQSLRRAALRSSACVCMCVCMCVCAHSAPSSRRPTHSLPVASIYLPLHMFGAGYTRLSGSTHVHTCRHTPVYVYTRAHTNIRTVKSRAGKSRPRCALTHTCKCTHTHT